MSPSLALSIAFGLVLAVLNGVVSVVVLKRAYGRPTAVFMRRVFKSLGLRLLAIPLVFGLVLWQVPVRPLAFGLAFVGGLVGMLVVEMWIVLKWTRVHG